VVRAVGWRRLPLPSEPRALAVHHLNGLRELRGALHGGATLATGLTPLEAVLVKQPYMAPMFGWAEPHPDVSALSDRWQEAEDGTNRAIATAFATLDEAEREELAALVEQLQKAAAG
jgi:hypothetical protein